MRRWPYERTETQVRPGLFGFLGCGIVIGSILAITLVSILCYLRVLPPDTFLWSAGIIIFIVGWLMAFQTRDY